jgi:hypothetical protein
MVVVKMGKGPSFSLRIGWVENSSQSPLFSFSLLLTSKVPEAGQPSFVPQPLVLSPRAEEVTRYPSNTTSGFIFTALLHSPSPRRLYYSQ